MIANYFKIALRVLWKNKWQTLINIFGLGIGIGCCLLIVLFVSDELSFDTFHTKSDRIYRAWFNTGSGDNGSSLSTITPFPIGPALKDNFEEIEHVVRIVPISPWVKVGDDQYTEKVTFVGTDFFQVFDFPLANGVWNRETLGPKDIVLSLSKAVKFFGSKNPLDQVVSVQIGQNFEDFTVKEVVADAPSNSSISFDLLISEENLAKLYAPETLNSDWIKGYAETYVLLREGTQASVLEAKFQPLLKDVLDEEVRKNYSAGLQPITDIHLNNNFPSAFTPIGNIKNSLILGGIGLLILFMACINFITLSIGMSLGRSKEVGLRKSIGAQQSQIIAQFIGEASVVTVISLVAGFLICILGLPWFNELSGKVLIFEPNGVILISGLILLIVIGFISGSYPAFFLSALRPIVVLRQKVELSSKQALRKTLVAFQMILSIFLLSSTLTMHQQLEFVQTKDMGFEKDGLILMELNVPRTGNLMQLVVAGFDKAKQFGTELAKYPNITVCAASHGFGTGNWTTIGFTDDKGTFRNFNVNIVDEKFIAALEMEMVAGRDFSLANPADALGAIIVNEAFVKAYDMKNPIGMRIPGKNFADHEIVGVVKDFNYSSLYNKVEPLVLTMNIFIPLSGQENITITSSPIPKLIIKLPEEQQSDAIAHIKTAWEKLSSNEEFSMQFVDEQMNAQYRADQHLGQIVKISSVIAMLIGCLGLYALVALTMQSRVKEVSIRKIMGASENYLMIFLARGYFNLMIICLLISAPITYYFTDQWLQTFQYRITPGAKVFGLTAILSIIFLLIVISYHTIALARTQPTKGLRN